MASEQAQGIRWNLNDLYADLDDPRIEQDLQTAATAAARFETDFRGRIGNAGELTAELLRAAIERYEKIDETIARPYYFAMLRFAADTPDAANKRFMQRMQELYAEHRNHCVFFDLELVQLPEEAVAALLEDDRLANYRHYIQALRRYREHVLSEPEEKLLNSRDLTGKQAFSRLFTELTSSFNFELEIDGEQKQLTASEMLAFAHHPDRDLRRRALETFYQKHEDNSLALTFIFDTLVQDHAIENRIRKYESPIQPTHLANEIDGATVDRMMAVTRERYDLPQRYFRVKAKLLGIDVLESSDIYAPLAATARQIDYDAARALVTEAFGGFHPDFAAIAERFFAGDWIDAEVRHGKRGGAFCASTLPSLHPYVLMNFTDNVRDVMTLAHELGHGLHFVLSGKQTMVNFHAPLPLAETASVFAEILVTRLLLDRETDARARLGIICSKLEDIFATVSRQNVLTSFEIAAHDHRREAPLTAEVLCDLWLQHNSELFGDAVCPLPGYKWGWSYIPHFIHSRFYCYSYVFGELLTLALYETYIEEGDTFIPRYLELLSAGGSDAPPALLQRAGIDIHDPDFWHRGFAFIEQLVDDAETLAAAGAAPTE